MKVRKAETRTLSDGGRGGLAHEHGDTWRPRVALRVTKELEESVSQFPATVTKRNM